MVKLLIDLGANVNHMDKRNGTALHVAITWGKLYAFLVLYFLSMPYSLLASVSFHDDHSRTLGQPEIVKILIASGANVNLADDNLQTSLHFAVKRGLSRWAQDDIMELLIKNGANVELKDKDQKTALDLANKSGYQWNPFQIRIN